MPWLIAMTLIIVIIATILTFVIYSSQTKPIGPNQALLIWGRETDMGVVLTGRAFVWPLLEKNPPIYL